MAERGRFEHLALPDGCMRPYRPKPVNFREVYIRNGWDGADGPIEEIFGTNWRVIRRWIEEEGRDDLIAERADYVRKERRRRYVLGRTMTAVRSRRAKD